MNNANKIAKHLAPIDRNDFRALKNVFVTVVASIVLAACGGGAETVENQQVGGTGPVDKDAPYSGPVARDGDVLRFQQEFWSNVRTADRCGNCHNETVARSPMFARSDDINMAYDTAVGLIDVNQPSASAIVAKVYSDGNGHNCWVADASVCQTIMTTWIENWLGGAGGGGRSIILTPPVSQDPGASKNFPPDATTTGSNGTSFANTVYPVLTANCSGCHSSEAGTPIQPYFADPNVDGAYEAAKSKMNLDTPAFSRFVERLSNEFHNCWTNSCTNDGQEMLAAITAFANGIALTQVDPNLTTSKAMRLTDGTLASGGNRFEDAQVALWEFKTGAGTVAFDTSGVDPAIDLNLSSEVTWFGGWGITTNGGRAQATTTSSRKLYDVLQESGEFSIEAWVVPANVTQEMARIVSYSANSTSRNFALQQTLYNYDFLLRTNETSLNGDPALSTPDADEVLQATLQHVVATYDPIQGRQIYVNGVLVSQTDP
ncbi:MAG: LamG-like jellyroll fold domain-containing protein, partial [Woeseiaceae bacterium]